MVQEIWLNKFGLKDLVQYTRVGKFGLEVLDCISIFSFADIDLYIFVCYSQATA